MYVSKTKELLIYLSYIKKPRFNTLHNTSATFSRIVVGAIIIRSCAGSNTQGWGMEFVNKQNANHKHKSQTYARNFKGQTAKQIQKSSVIQGRRS